jgi:hypothetical protein
MLNAEKTSIWSSRYDISDSGRQIARWEPSWWRSGGAFELDGQRYEVRSTTWGSRFELLGPHGAVLASAERVGRKRWTLRAGDRSYQFRRASMWRSDQELLLDDLPVGSIRRTSAWRSSAVADLPGLPLPVQVFVLCVVLALWARAATTTGAVAASGGSPP